MPASERPSSSEPKHAIAHFRLGTCLLDQRKWEAAAPCFEKAIEFGRRDTNAYNNLGFALLRLGKLDQAIPYCQKAIELDPKHTYAHDNLGLVYLNQKKLDEAVICFRKATEVAPKFAGARANLGVALAKQKKLGQAIECYRKAIELDPKYAFAHLELGLALHAQGKLDEAIAENAEALRLDPEDSRSRRWLLDTLAPLGRLEEARAAWEQALASNPPDHDAWFGYAELCLFLNNEDAYRRNRKALLDRFAKTTNPAIAEPHRSAPCLLLPAEGEELRQATALADRAVERGKNSNDFRFYAVAKALAEYRRDRFESRNRIGAGSPGPETRHLRIWCCRWPTSGWVTRRTPANSWPRPSKPTTGRMDSTSGAGLFIRCAREAEGLLKRAIRE